MTRTEMLERLELLNAELDGIRERLADTDDDALVDTAVSIKEEIDALGGALEVLESELAKGQALILAWLKTPDEPDPIG